MGRGKRLASTRRPANGAAGALRPRDVLLEQSEHLAITVTPGLLDDRAVVAFGRGQCHALALALHDETGWPLYALEDDEADACHVFVRTPDGLALDAGGACPIDELSELWSAVYVEPYARSQVASLHEDGTWREPALAVAAAFVPSVLARYHQRAPYRHPDELDVEAEPAPQLTMAGAEMRHRLQRGVWDQAAERAFADGQSPALLLALSLAERSSHLCLRRGEEGEISEVLVSLADGRLVGGDGVIRADGPDPSVGSGSLETTKYRHVHAELVESARWPVPDVAAGQAFLSCWRAAHDV